MLDHDLVFYGLTILVFLLISAFFAAAETALTAVTRARLYQLVMDGNKRAELASKIRREKESLIGTVLLGNNAVNIGASAVATSLAIRVFGNNEEGLLLVTLVMTFLIVVFAEILPKTYAIQNAERTALALSPALNFFIRLLSPITRSMQAFIRGMLKIVGVDISKSSNLTPVTDVLRGTIEFHHRQGQMIKQDRDMLGSILDLNDREVKHIMIHRKQVETLDASLPPEELVSQAVATLHSRIPLWRGQADNIIGILHVKSLIKALGGYQGTISSERILSICTKPWFIPETTNLRQQLLAFRNKRQHIALVVDEYGGWQGIVTLEDIIEEIVGDIDDEHDETVTGIQNLGNNIYMVAGSVPVRDLNRQLDWKLPEDDASTIAGLLIHEAETIPPVGQHFDFHGIRFTVIEKDATHITRLKLQKLAEAKPSQHAEI